MTNYSSLEQLYTLFDTYTKGFKEILDQPDLDDYAKRDRLNELGKSVGLLS